MSTGDTRVRIYNKRRLPVDQLGANFLDYLLASTRDTLERMYRRSGVFDSGITVGVGSADLAIDIAPGGGDGFMGTDGLGFLTNIAGADDDYQNVPIPAGTHGADYFHVGLNVEEVEQGVEINSRTGAYQYKEYIEMVGYIVALDPGDVTDNGDGTISFKVDELFDDDGEDHSGTTGAKHQVRVWLKSKEDGGSLGPLTDDTAVAFETCEVTYGTYNKITTTGKFGQTGNPSTTPGDYVVMLVGPRVANKAATNMTNLEGCLFVCEVDTRPSGLLQIGDIVTTDQNVIVDVLGAIGDVVRTDSGSDRLRVQVTAHDDDADHNQGMIRVVDRGGTEVFTVRSPGGEAPSPEDTRVIIDGDLQVTGTEFIETSQAVSGDCRIGDDIGDTCSMYAILKLMQGPFGAPAGQWADIHIGDGSAAVPGSRIIFDAGAGGQDIVFKCIAGDGAANDLIIERADAEGGITRVVLRNTSSGGQVGLTLRGDLDVGDEDSLQTNSPTVKFRTTGDTWEIRSYNGQLRVTSPSSIGEEIIRFTNPGAGYTTIQGEVFEAIEGPLYLDDTNLAAKVPLTASGVTALTTAAQNIVGAINEAAGLTEMIRQSGIKSFSGLVCSDGGGTTVDYTTGVAYANGREWTISGSTLTGFTVGTWYVYVDGADGVVKKTAVKATAFALDNLPLSTVVSNGSAVTMTNCRIGAPRLTQRHVVTVGRTHATNDENDFSTLNEALDWIEAWRTQLATVSRPEVKIVINGMVNQGADIAYIKEIHTGLVIEGVAMADLADYGDEYEPGEADYGDAMIRWTGNGCVVVQDNVQNLAIRNVFFGYDSATGKLSRHISFASSATIRRVRIEGCRFAANDTAYTQAIYSPASTPLTDSVIRDNLMIARAGNAPERDLNGILGLLGGCEQCTITNNQIVEEDLFGDSYRQVKIDGFTRSTFRDNYIDWGGDSLSGVYFNDVSDSRIVDNHFASYGVEFVQISDSHIEGNSFPGQVLGAGVYAVKISNSSGGDVQLVGNQFSGGSIEVANTGTAARIVVADNCMGPVNGQIICAWDDATIVNNLFPVGAGSHHGIFTTGDGCLIEGNLFGAQGGVLRVIEASGDECIVRSNLVRVSNTAADAYGIYVSGADAIVGGNEAIHTGIPGADGWGIYVTGGGPVIQGNLVRNFKGGIIAQTLAHEAVIGGNRIVYEGALYTIIGIEIRCDYATISGNMIRINQTGGSWSATGISIGQAAASSDYVSIVGNTIRSVDGHMNGIDVEEGENGVIQGNVIQIGAAGYKCIWLQTGADYWNAQGNMLRYGGGTALTDAGNFNVTTGGGNVTRA